MKYIISEQQFDLILDQSDYMIDKRGNAILNAKGIRTDNDFKKVNQIINKSQGHPIDPHALTAILGLATAFIPVVGPFISAGIGLVDAAMYYNEGDKKSAGMVAVLSMIPFASGIVSKIPAIKKIGPKGMALIAKKLSSKNQNLTKIESDIVNSMKYFTPKIQQELSKMAPKLKSIFKEIELYRPNFIKKYGEYEYGVLLAKYLYGGISQSEFITTLKNVKAPNIKLKPILGIGQDHKVYEIISNPKQIVKVEVKPGKVDEWYNIFMKYPNFFPKIYRKTKIKGKNGELFDAVVMEKLDTKPFMDMWDELEVALYESQKSLPVTQQMLNLEYLLKNIGKYPRFIKLWDNAVKVFKTESPELSSKVDEFTKVIKKAHQLAPPNKIADIRKYNLGYDENGVLKVLDL